MCYEIGDRIKDEKRDLTITDKKYFIQANRKAWYYKYHCNICGYDCDVGYRAGKLVKATWFSKQQLENGAGCPCCHSRIIVPKINSIRATNPELSKYFMNNDDMKYSIFSGQRTHLICPFCGTIKKDMVISSLSRQGFGCPVCSDNASLGERIMYYILQHSGMKFKKEFMFDNNKWRYDFYLFKHNAIIEVHGEQHYEQTTFGDLLLNQKNDRLKKEFALSKGILKYIVIDARKSNFDYIVNSIIQSDFGCLYDLNFVVWDEIREYLFNNSLQKDICDYWELHKNVTYVDMENIFNLSESTIRKYLNNGYKLGWCHKDDSRFSKTESLHLHDLYERKYPLTDLSTDCRNNCMPILYIPENIYFKSIRLCSDNIEKYIGRRVPQSTIRYKLKRNSQEFKYITKEEFNNAFYNNEHCYGTPYDEIILKKA